MLLIRVSAILEVIGHARRLAYNFSSALTSWVIGNGGDESD